MDATAQHSQPVMQSSASGHQAPRPSTPSGGCSGHMLTLDHNYCGGMIHYLTRIQDE